VEGLVLNNYNKTLVDSVEESLVNYFKEKGFRPGSSIPSETELAEALGVGRSVVREALSRFKMTGMIISRTRKGMILAEPSLFSGIKSCINPLLMNSSTLDDILGLRVALEVGISSNIFRNITPKDIKELEDIVAMGEATGINKYTPFSEHQFHTKLYEITGNKMISDFQDVIYPVLDYVKQKHQDDFEPIEAELASEGKLVNHSDLLDYIKKGDLPGYKVAIEQHFRLYTIYLSRRQK